MSKKIEEIKEGFIDWEGEYITHEHIEEIARQIKEAEKRGKEGF